MFFIFAKRRHVAIDLKHGPISEQLLTAVNDDLSAVLTEMPQFAGPITVVSKSRDYFGKLDWELGLQERVATAADRLL